MPLTVPQFIGPAMVSVPVFVLNLLALLALCMPVANGRPTPFGTINGKLFGIIPPVQHAEHERITRAALGCSADNPVDFCFEALSLDQLAGAEGTIGAIGAPDINEVCASNVHCDDADYF